MKKQHINAAFCTCIIGITLLCGIVYISGSQVGLIRAVAMEEDSSESNTIKNEPYIAKDEAIEIQNDEDVVSAKEDENTVSQNDEDTENLEEDYFTDKSVAEIKSIVLLDNVYYVLDVNGIVWKWNEDETKEEAKPVVGMKNVVKIMDAGVAVYALTEEGDVYAWGCNRDYMIQQKNSHGKEFDEPVKLSSLENIEDIDSGDGRAFAIDSSGRLYVWGIGIYVNKKDKKPKHLKVDDNSELTENVREIFMGAGHYHYFMRENESVFSIMDPEDEMDGLSHYIFPNFDGVGISEPCWWDDPNLFWLKKESNLRVPRLYEMGDNKDIMLISADNYTMYMYNVDNALWYWNSDRITYHDYPRAGTKINTYDLDYNGSFEYVDIKSIVGIEVDSEEDLRIVSICPCKENVLFLLNNGQVFASEYVTTEIKDVEYYYIVHSNPQNSAPDIEYNMNLKGISFYKLDYENIVSISSDKDSNFYLADESGNIIHYIAEQEE